MVVSALEWLYAEAQVLQGVYTQANYWLTQIFISTATDIFLDQHGKDRNTSRRLNEPDPVYQARIRQIEDVVTDPALQNGINLTLQAEVVISADTTITIQDSTQITPLVINVPMGTYTTSAFQTLVQNQFYTLPPGATGYYWSLSLVNARWRFEADNPAGGDLVFSVTFGDSDIQNALGFSSLFYLNWDTSSSGYLESESFVFASLLQALRATRGHFQSPGHSTAFEGLTLGYRMGSNTPMTYIVQVPSGTDTTTVNAIAEYLRLNGPAGYGFQIEVAP